MRCSREIWASTPRTAKKRMAKVAFSLRTAIQKGEKMMIDQSMECFFYVCFMVFPWFFPSCYLYHVRRNLGLQIMSAAGDAPKVCDPAIWDVSIFNQLLIQLWIQLLGIPHMDWWMKFGDGGSYCFTNISLLMLVVSGGSPGDWTAETHFPYPWIYGRCQATAWESNPQNEPSSWGLIWKMLIKHD